MPGKKKATKKRSAANKPAATSPPNQPEDDTENAATSGEASGGTSGGGAKDLADLAGKYAHTKQHRFVLTEDWKKENGITLPAGTVLTLTKDEVETRQIPARLDDSGS